MQRPTERANTLLTLLFLLLWRGIFFAAKYRAEHGLPAFQRRMNCWGGRVQRLLLCPAKPACSDLE